MRVKAPPHEVLVHEGSEEYVDLSEFITQMEDPICNTVKTATSACESVRPGQQRLRRLTPKEYDRTVKDLLGVTSDWGTRMVKDTVINHFDNHAEALTVTSLLADQLWEAADDLSSRAHQYSLHCAAMMCSIVVLPRDVRGG